MSRRKDNIYQNKLPPPTIGPISNCFNDNPVPPMRYIGYPGNGIDGRSAFWSRPESQRSLVNGFVGGSDAGSQTAPSILSTFNEMRGMNKGEISIASSVM